MDLCGLLIHILWFFRVCSLYNTGFLVIDIIYKYVRVYVFGELYRVITSFKFGDVAHICVCVCRDVVIFSRSMQPRWVWRRIFGLNCLLASVRTVQVRATSLPTPSPAPLVLPISFLCPLVSSSSCPCSFVSFPFPITIPPYLIQRCTFCPGVSESSIDLISSGDHTAWVARPSTPCVA